MEPEPTSLDEVDFFTRQILKPSGFAFMWVYKPICPKCGKSRLKKLKKRDKVYTCVSCGYTAEKDEYNSMLKYNVKYTCPNCGHKGEAYGKWDKPKSKTATIVLKIKCESCNAPIKIVRMKRK